MRDSPKTQNKTRAGSKIEHVVASGESFWTISRRYNVSHRQLAAWNGMAPGDTLVGGPEAGRVGRRHGHRSATGSHGRARQYNAQTPLHGKKR